MKVMTILGTRPEIIRLSRVMPLLDELSRHVLVHTGQNFEPQLNNVFFSELGLRPPDYSLNCTSNNTIDQIAAILSSSEKVLSQEKPDRVLILGDTNSALSAVAAKRMGIPIFHMEAGNRCYDDRVPEEVNRRIVDHCSDILLPYTERSRANLLEEGIPSKRIFVTGNPIFEVLEFYDDGIQASTILDNLRIEPGGYFLVTLHRAENVDLPGRLHKFIEALHLVNLEYDMPVVCSLHPRTRSQLLKSQQVLVGGGVHVVEPLGFFDFVKLEKYARCVLSDSGTVQEECSIMGIPNVTLRDVTERPETLESGSNIISGCEPDSILQALHNALYLGCDWQAPPEYTRKIVSSVVARLVLGFLPIR